VKNVENRLKFDRIDVAMSLGYRLLSHPVQTSCTTDPEQSNGDV